MATHADLKQMMANDPRLKTLFLTYTLRLNNDDFRLAIAENTLIEEIVISADASFFQECSEVKLQGALEAIGRLPKLRKLTINSYPKSEGKVSLRAIKPIVLGATNLEEIFICDLQVTGSPQDFEVFAERVQRMNFLRVFCFSDCKVSLESSNLTDSQQSCVKSSAFAPQEQDLLKSLMMSLSILPSLEVVVFQAQEEGGLGRLSTSAASSLCLSASIRVIELRMIELSGAHISSMAQLLLINRSLVSLELGSIQRLDREAAIALGNVFKANTALERLELSLVTMIPDFSAHVLSSALRHNCRLRSFTLTASNSNNSKIFGRVTTKCRQAFLEMLKYNYALKQFFLFRKFPLRRELKMYAELNKMGRGNLLQASSNCPEAWLEKLAELKDDLNSIYYLLSSNPTLCIRLSSTSDSFDSGKLKKRMTETGEPKRKRLRAV